MKTIQNTITINVPTVKVWDALVNPEKTRVYMFGCEAISDWKIGSPLVWNAVYEGSLMTFVKGAVVAYEPPTKLAYTKFDPNNPAMPDVPENYLTVTYELKEQDGQTIFSVTQGDYDTVAEGEKRYTETYNNGEGWNPILVHIKALVESE